MIKLENTAVMNMDNAIRGMRNPMDSWDKSDSYWGCYPNSKQSECGEICYNECDYIIGEKDLKLAKSLAHNGSDHRKFLRQIMVSVDITAPLYWWKEFDTYKVGTVANSCSTMHTIHKRDLTLDDFSCEYLVPESIADLQSTIIIINEFRQKYINWTNSNFYITANGQCVDKDCCWYQMIQLLPSSYNQKRTVTLNYEVLLNQYHARNAHKLDEWHLYCDWIKSLPYFKEICLEN